MRTMPQFEASDGYQFAGSGMDSGGGGDPYVLPTATANRLGGVKVGDGLEVDEDGTLSTSGGGGGIEIGTTPKKIGKFGNSDMYALVIEGTGINAFQSLGTVSNFTKILSINGTLENNGAFYDLFSYDTVVMVGSDGTVAFQSVPSGWSSGKYHIVIIYI